MESEVLKHEAAPRPLAQIVEMFWNRTFPYDEWNHQAHLAVGLDAIAKWDSEEALVRLRDGIRAYNEANAVLNSPTSGYHETLTRIFIGAINDCYQKHQGEELETLFPKLLAEWGDKNRILAYYSRRHLFSPYARMDWRSPDLQPLPFRVPATEVDR